MLNGIAKLGVAAAAAAGLVAAPPPAFAQNRAQQVQPPYTSSRLTLDLMERLVPEPLGWLEAGDLAGAEAAFDRQYAVTVRREGAGSVASGDLLVSFGMLMFDRGTDRAARLRGIDYLRRGAGAYVAALGRDYPEVGLTMADIGFALLALDPAAPPPEAAAALEEAWRIRRVTLGPNNVETASSLATVARLRGHHALTRGDRARIDAAAAQFREAARDFGTLRVAPGLFGSITTTLDLARMYRANGLVPETVEAVIEAQADYRAHFGRDRPMCEVLVRHSLSIAAALARSGSRAEAQRIRTGLNGLPCYEGEAAYGRLIDFILPRDVTYSASGGR